jgi:hypothetical protein
MRYAAWRHPQRRACRLMANQYIPDRKAAGSQVRLPVSLLVRHREVLRRRTALDKSLQLTNTLPHTAPERLPDGLSQLP